MREMFEKIQETRSGHMLFYLISPALSRNSSVPRNLCTLYGVVAMNNIHGERGSGKGISTLRQFAVKEL